MTIEEILKLGAMGYTKEDIEAMGKAPEPEADTEPAKDPEPMKEEPAPVQQETDMLKFIAGEFEKLNKAITQANIINSDIAQHNEKTAEDVLAELIAPPQKKEVKTK